ncbi:MULTISPECIES: helix-turn-helix domain-containing protein [Streptomyces]|uniref:helix-turn-helix domain-containing protein n=1 Tax=Streptomyces TaxID=1883 RepID=UPI000DA623CE|nr:helix-turn-helix transcriptional regulator [Streptomyces sp. SID7805]MYU51303.1 helix-turn-helix domain-containing protein [Streptomyces sp. SID7805]
MTQDDWSGRLARRIAGEVRRFRRHRGMSAQQLSDRCTELGMPIARSVLANFESGRRPTISVAEILVIAQALRVPPVALIFPVGYEGSAEVLPGQTADAFEAAQWFTGEAPGHTGPEGWRYTDPDADDFEDTPFGIYRFRRHEELVRALVSHQLRADEKMRRAAQMTDKWPEVELRRALIDVAEEMEEATHRGAEEVESIRRELREEGMTPPPLPYYLAPYFREDVERPAFADPLRRLLEKKSSAGEDNEEELQRIEEGE